MYNRSEYEANIQLVDTKTYSRGITAKRKSSVSFLAWFILMFGLIGYLLIVGFFAG